MARKSSNILLEPDQSLLDQHLLFTKADDEIENFLLNPAREQHSKPWTIIKPSPGFCVKLRNSASDGEKVFINICKTDEIPGPEEISEAELMKILSSDEPSSYRVPMSIGEERTDSDKSGKLCSVFDVVINTGFFKKVENNQLFKSFLITATLEALEDKYNLILEKEEFVVLKNVKCKGKMTEHRIQVRSKPLVEILSGDHQNKLGSKVISKSDSEKKLLISECANTDSDKTGKPTDAIEPSYTLSLLDSEENKQKFILAKFFLKDILLAKEIDLDVGEDRILLQTVKKNYFIDIFLPYLIHQEKVMATFSLINKVLTVKMPAAI